MYRKKEQEPNLSKQNKKNRLKDEIENKMKKLQKNPRK